MPTAAVCLMRNSKIQNKTWGTVSEINAIQDDNTARTVSIELHHTDLMNFAKHHFNYYQLSLQSLLISQVLGKRRRHTSQAILVFQAISGRTFLQALPGTNLPSRFRQDNVA